MKTIMSRTPHESSFSFSRRHFNWKINTDTTHDNEQHQEEKEETTVVEEKKVMSSGSRKAGIAVARLRSVLANLSKRRVFQFQFHLHPSGLGSKVIGTLFGYRRGHVHFAFQEDGKANPAFLIELATPTNGLVREMATGLVRIALECDKKKKEEEDKKGGVVKLLEEPLWRTYCNGKKCGYGVRRECRVEDLKILKALEPISMGAGVLPFGGGGEVGDQLMYMRAKFERVVGSRDSEAFYMMNPDGNGGPELSIYLLRV